MCASLEIVSLQTEGLKTPSWSRAILGQSDWCPYGKEMWTQTQAVQRADDMKTQGGHHVTMENKDSIAGVLGKDYSCQSVKTSMRQSWNLNSGRCDPSSLLSITLDCFCF